MTIIHYSFTTVNYLWQPEYSFLIIFPLQDIPGSKENVSFSLGSVLLLPVMLLITLTFSSATRIKRLAFYFPLQIMLLSVVAPIIIISRNKKMTHVFNANYVDPMTFKIMYTLKRLRKLLSSSVQPIWLSFKRLKSDRWSNLELRVTLLSNGILKYLQLH